MPAEIVVLFCIVLFGIQFKLWSVALLETTGWNLADILCWDFYLAFLNPGGQRKEIPSIYVHTKNRFV